MIHTLALALFLSAPIPKPKDPPRHPIGKWKFTNSTKYLFELEIKRDGTYRMDVVYDGYQHRAVPKSHNYYAGKWYVQNWTLHMEGHYYEQRCKTAGYYGYKFPLKRLRMTDPNQGTITKLP